MEVTCRQFSTEKTNSYILSDNKHCIVIDPCSADLVSFISSQRLSVDYIVLTHEHCDHLWGVNALRSYSKCPLIASTECSRRIQSSKTNRAREHHIYMALRFGAAYANEDDVPDYCCERADIEFTGQLALSWHSNTICLKSTPGHSQGSITISVNEAIVFSGDSLLKGEATFTKFEGGDGEKLKNTVFPYYKTFSADVLVMPGHGDSFLLKDYDFLGGGGNG